MTSVLVCQVHREGIQIQQTLQVILIMFEFSCEQFRVERKKFECIIYSFMAGNLGT